jgi:pimeloyl-ACP methyl ester carboxylesterase
MSGETTRLVPTCIDKDGVSYADTIHSPVDNKVRAECTVRPWTIVPVVFVPGIMGSNLRAAKDIWLNQQKIFSKDDRVWKVDSLTSPMSMWGKSPAYRQAVFNKDAIAVDNSGKIGQGAAAADPFGPPLSTGATPLSRVSADEARRRGWGSASWKYYGDFLDWLQYQLSDGRLVGGKPNAVFEKVAKLVGTSPQGAKTKVAGLTDAQVRKMLDIHFPVYAVGYNWLQSNLDSGRDLVNGIGEGDSRVLGINEIIKRHDGIHGQTCKQVIIVTHSMGGLVARAAALQHGVAGKILGIVHGVQPIDGAAAFYKRIAAGFEGEGWGTPWATSHVLGPTSRETIPELAYNPGPLELAPSKRYQGGRPWLFIKDQQGRVLKALPEHGDPYKEIYLDTTHVWRAVNPEWLNPAGATIRPEIEFGRAVGRASDYHDQLGGKLHPKTYAHWGADADHESWGSMTWTAEAGETYTPSGWDMAMSRGMARSQWLPDRQHTPTMPEQWSFQTPVTAAGTERELLSAQKKEIHMSVDGPSDAGDGTVPAAASGAQIANYPGCQIGCALTGFDHQGDYNDNRVRNVLLDALVRLVEPVVVTG